MGGDVNSDHQSGAIVHDEAGCDDPVTTDLPGDDGDRGAVRGQCHLT